MCNFIYVIFSAQRYLFFSVFQRFYIRRDTILLSVNFIHKMSSFEHLSNTDGTKLVHFYFFANYYHSFHACLQFHQLILCLPALLALVNKRVPHFNTSKLTWRS